MKLICIADFRIDENGLWSSYNLGESIAIERTLQKNDVEAYVYYEKDLGSISDIAEDLTSFSDEYIILITDEANYKLNTAIANQIVEEEEECKVILKIREGYGENKAFSETTDDNCTIVSSFYELFAEIDEEISVSDIEDIEEYDNSESLNGKDCEIEILLGYKCREIVYSRKIELIKNDVQNLIKGNDKSCIRFVGICIEEYKYGQELIDYLSQFETVLIVFDTNYKTMDLTLSKQIRLNVKLSLEYLSNGKVDFSSVEKNINKVLVPGKIFDDLKSAKKIISSILKYTSNIEFKNAKDIDLDIIKKCVPRQFFELMNKRYQTLSRGILISKTGEYVSVPLTGFVKHLYINSSDVNNKTLEFAKEVCSINSSLFIGDVDKRSYFDKCKIDSLDDIKQINSTVKGMSEIVDEVKCFPINIACLNENSLDINGIMNNAGLKIMEMPYSEFKQPSTKDYRNLYVLSVDSEKDFDCLINQTKEYYVSKKIADSYLLNAELKNKCRFMSRNYCSVTKISRLAVGVEGKVFPCYEMNESIGNIESSVYELTQEVYYKHQMNLKNNQCAKCSASISCPKCIYMPAFIKDKYCDIMINMPYITDFIIESMVVSSLMRTNLKMQKQNPKDLLLSNEYMQNILIDEEYGEENPYFFKYTFLILAKDLYAIWSPNKNKTFSISREFAIVCEAIFKRLPPDKIVQVVSEKISLSIEDARKFCSNVVKILLNNNMLHREISINE